MPLTYKHIIQHVYVVQSVTRFVFKNGCDLARTCFFRNESNFEEIEHKRNALFNTIIFFVSIISTMHVLKRSDFFTPLSHVSNRFFFS